MLKDFITQVKGIFSLGISRFMSVWKQTIISLPITSFITLSVFAFFVGTDKQEILSFMSFGLMGSVIVQTSFQDSSSFVIQAKMFKYFSDYIYAPISSHAFILGHIISSAVRAILSALFFYLIISVFIGLKIPNNLIILLSSTILISSMMSIFGIIIALKSKTFDQLSVFLNYILAPLSSLSGTFFPITKFPDTVIKIIKFNPIFYAIDLTRFNFIEISQSESISRSWFFLISATILLYLTAVKVFNSYTEQ